MLERNGTLLKQDDAAALQKSDGSTSSAKSSGGMNLPLVISLPILFILVTIVIVLVMILVWYMCRSKKKKEGLQIGMGRGYTSIPTECVDIPPSKSPSGKPKVKLLDPPIPGVSTQFVEAAQLGSPIEGVSLGSRYPFTTERAAKSGGREKKPHRKLSNRRGRPSGIPRHTHSTDRSSDGSEEGYSSPRALSSWRSSATPTATPSPERHGSRTLSGTVMEQGEDSSELSLCLKFDEKEARLTVKVEKAMKLPNRPNGEAVDSYVRIYFVPKLSEMPQRKTSKTNVIKGDCDPVYNESVHYEAMTMAELINSVLHVEVLDIPDLTGFGKHTLLGRTDLHLVQVQFIAGEAPLTIPLKLPPVREDLGTILVSLTYTPESKKLSVILLRAKDLNKGDSHATDAQAKISVTLNGDKILGKLKTKKKTQSCSPIFNETLSCSVEPSQVKNTAVTIAVFNENRSSKCELGQIILCNQCKGDEYRHWSDVMASPGKPISEWHDLK